MTERLIIELAQRPQGRKRPVVKAIVLQSKSGMQAIFYKNDNGYKYAYQSNIKDNLTLPMSIEETIENELWLARNLQNWDVIGNVYY